MIYTHDTGAPLTKEQWDYNFQQLSLRYTLATGKPMPVTLRQNLSRPLTNREADSNLQNLDAGIRRLEYGDGPYPVLDQTFVGASFLDPRITFTRPGKSWRIVNGVLREYDVNEPVLTPEGWSVRRAETNLAWPSENLGAWNTQGASISGAKGPSPDGGNAAEYLVPASNANGVAQVYKTFTVAPNTDYVVYAFGRAGAYGRSYLQSNFGGSFSTGTTHFDLVAGTVLAVNPALTAGVVPVPLSGGWYLTWHTGKTGASQTSLQMSVGCCPPGSATGTGSTPGAVAGDGVSGIWVFGGLLALGSSPIPYIPTTSAAVTRPADNALIQGADFADVFNPVEGAIFLDLTRDSAKPPSGEFALSMHNGTTTKYAGISVPGTVTGRFGPGINILGPACPPGTRVKAAIRWKNDVGTLAANGSIIGSSAFSAGLMSDLIVSNIGGFLGNPGLASACTFHRLSIFDRALSDAQMEAHTS